MLLLFDSLHLQLELTPRSRIGHQCIDLNHEPAFKGDMRTDLFAISLDQHVHVIVFSFLLRSFSICYRLFLVAKCFLLQLSNFFLVCNLVFMPVHQGLKTRVVLKGENCDQLDLS